MLSDISGKHQNRSQSNQINRSGKIKTTENPNDIATITAIITYNLNFFNFNFYISNN